MTKDFSVIKRLRHLTNLAEKNKAISINKQIKNEKKEASQEVADIILKRLFELATFGFGSVDIVLKNNAGNKENNYDYQQVIDILNKKEIEVKYLKTETDYHYCELIWEKTAVKCLKALDTEFNI